MKVAIFGDIHGNLEALKAAYSETVSKGIDKIYHLGDLGGYAPFVNEVVEFLTEHRIEGVKGNYDETVANDREHCGCKYEDPVQEEMANLSFEWTKKHASRKTKEYLKKLPFSISLQAEGKKVLLFHATPGKNNLYWYEERPEKFFREMARKVETDIMIYGHTHKPYRKDIEGKVFINAGSVGKPKDGDPRACVALVEITKDAVTTNFLRVPYDIEATAEAIIEKGLPGYFAERLKEAR
ncbi:MAG TPA: YfcE family phosphodiesterase [Nitrospiraceae bacterium]|jgi:putative phosphoesterase|nr:YfcE family phosphodiesterase [Nitrospiraceae bacterium]